MAAALRALPLPDGWQQADTAAGLVFGPGADAAELLAAAPTGPRVTVLPPGDAPDFNSMLADVGAETPTLVLLEEPITATVGTLDVVSIVLQEGSDDAAVVRRYLFAAARGDTALHVVMEAPAAQWEASRPDLEAFADVVLQSLSLP